MQITDYARWIFFVRQHDNDGKIKWDKMKKRLRDQYLSAPFWNAYYTIKNEVKTGVTEEEMEKAWKEYQETWKDSNGNKNSRQ